MTKRYIASTSSTYKSEDYLEKLKALKNYLQFDNLRIKKKDEENDSFSKEDQKEFMEKLKDFVNSNGYTISGHSTISGNRKTIKPFPRVHSRSKESEIISKALIHPEVLSEKSVDIYELDLLKEVDDYLGDDKEYTKLRSSFKLEDDELSSEDFVKLKEYVDKYYHAVFDLNALIARLSMFER